MGSSFQGFFDKNINVGRGVIHSDSFSVLIHRLEIHKSLG